MQVAGFPCAICSEKILFQAEGTWCGRCKTIFHATCQKVPAICSGCKQEFVPPETLFVYSRCCPNCVRPLAEGAETCGLCGGSARFDSEAHYQLRKKEIISGAWRLVITGAAELLFGALLVLGGFSLFLIIAIAAIAGDGGRRLLRGIEFLGFE